MGTVRLGLDEIELDPDLQCRVSMNEDVVNRYAERMKQGDDDFPAVVVFTTDGQRHLLADGWHRYAAARKAGRRAIKADVRHGDSFSALLFSASANERHGLARTVEDRQKAVERLARNPGCRNWSTKRIAGAADVSPHTVDLVRDRCEPGWRERLDREGVVDQNGVKRPRVAGKHPPARADRPVEDLGPAVGSLPFASAAESVKAGPGCLVVPGRVWPIWRLAATGDGARYAMRVVQLERSADGMATAAATDGRCLGLVQWQTGQTGSPLSVLVPDAGWKQAGRLATAGDVLVRVGEPVKVGAGLAMQTTRQVELTAAGEVKGGVRCPVTVAEAGGRFPDYRQILPADDLPPVAGLVNLNAAALAKLAEVVNLIVGDRDKRTGSWSKASVKFRPPMVIMAAASERLTMRAMLMALT